MLNNMNNRGYVFEGVLEIKNYKKLQEFASFMLRQICDVVTLIILMSL